MIVALDSSKLPQLCELIDDFKQEVRALSGDAKAGEKDDVYQVEVSIFPVTTLKQPSRSRDHDCS
jgi:hypothetical protein